MKAHYNYEEFKALSKIEQQSYFESQVKTRIIKNKNVKLYGVGIVDTVFPVGIKLEGKQILCPAYTTWQNMLRRCYYTKNTTNYSHAVVCEEWLSFKNFLEWWKQFYVEGWELDKDFYSLIKFNNHHQKLYSPETCRYVPKFMNLVYRSNKNGLLNIRQAA